MTDLLNIKTGKTETVDPVDVPGLLAAETHMPAGGARALLAPTGDLHIIPEAYLHQAVGQGYKLPSQADLDLAAKTAKFGGLAGEAKAFAAGAGRGASFGLSDLALTKTGLVNPETLQGLKDVNPASSVAGEVTGAVGSALLAPEASPAGLVSKLGAGVAEHLAPEGASALGQIAAHAAGAGAEGAVYGAGQSLSEAALGDPSATAEHLIANVGLGAVLGGGLGGLFKAGQLAVPASVDKAKDALARGWRVLWGDAEAPVERRAFYRTAEAVEPELGLAATGTDGAAAAPDLTPPGPAPEPKAGAIPRAVAKLNESLTGTPASDTLAAFQKRAGAQGEILSGPERDAFHKELNEALQETHDALEKASLDASTKVRAQESASLLEHADPVAAQAELQRVKGVMQHTVAEMRSSPELYPARFPAKLDQVLEGLEAGEHPEASAADIYAEITRARKAIDDKIPWNKEISGEASDAVNLTKQLRGQLKASLEDEQVWGEAAARTSAYNESLNDRLAALKEFRKRFMEKVPTRNGGVAYKIRSESTNQFLNQINDQRGETRARALREFFRTSLKHIDQMERTYKAAPFESFDKEALQSLVKKNNAQATRAQSIVAGQPGMGYGGIGNIAKMAVAGHFGGPLGAALSAGKGLLKPDAMAAGLANLERASLRTQSAVEGAVKAVFKPGASASRKGLGILSEKLTPAEKLEKIKGQVDETQDHVSSANNLVQALDEATRDGAHAAPKTMAAVQATALRGLQFLQSKIPPSEPSTPFEASLGPSPTALAAFGRYYRVVHDPLSVLGEMKSGMLAPESVEALRAVYPNLHQQIAQAAVEHAAGLMGQVPYRTRLLLSQFMGEPLDKSLTPDALQAVQMASAAPEPGSPGAPRPNAKGLQHLNLAGAMATDFQKTSLKERA